MKNNAMMPANHFVMVNHKMKIRIPVQNIIMLEGFNNYTLFHLQSGKQRLFARTIRHFEAQLLQENFIRIHRGFLVNSSCILGYDKEANKLQLKNNLEASISRRRRKNLSDFYLVENWKWNYNPNKKMKNIFSILLVLSCLSNTYAQIGIKANNSAPIPSAQLEVQSTTKAFYPPRMTTVQRNAIAGVAAGAIVFDTDLNGLFTYNGSSWVSQVGLTLPYSVSQNNTSELLKIVNTNTNTSEATIRGETNSLNGSEAIVGYSNNPNATGFTSGISGYNLSNNTNNRFGCGVYGEHTGFGRGVSGYSSFGIGVSGISQGIGGFFSGPSNGYALITEFGNVGIGIPAPLERLHVSGNIRASSLAGTGVRGCKSGC
jgi:LytTr DNA-binding domain